MKKYRAPWSITLIVISSAATAICIGVAITLLKENQESMRWLAALPILTVVGAAFFNIRGYVIVPEAVLIRRLFWRTRLPLADLQAVRFIPNVMRGSIRTFGNGGLFSFCGFYRNKFLGRYRAWVTNFGGTVVLRFASRTIVVSPDTPEQFVRELDLKFEHHDPQI
jgi:hypothetical protein